MTISETLGEQIRRLDQIPVMNRLLKSEEVRIEIIPITGGLLGMFRVYAKNPYLARIPFFENQSAVGFAVTDGPNFQKPDNPLLTHGLESGGHLPILTLQTFIHYVGFLEQISGKIFEDAGDRAYEASGLTAISLERSQRTIEEILQIIKGGGSFLRGHGVQNITRVDKLEILKFYDKSRGLISAPLCYLKRGKLIGEVVEEKITDTMEVSGIVLPLPGETKRGHYRRIKKFEHELKCKLASGWPGQVRLWQRLGFDTLLQSKDTQAQVKAHDLIRFLLLGESNLKPGPLARFTSLPHPGLQWSTLDIITNKVNPTTGMRNVTLIPVPIDVADKKKPNETLPLLGVGAFRVVSEGTTLFEQIDQNESLARDLARTTGTPNVKIALVNSELFETWKQRGTPISSQTKIQEAIKNLPIKKRIHYGLSGDREGIFYWEPWVQPGIGGGIRILEIKTANGHETSFLIPIDLGIHFNDEIPGYSGGMKNSPTAEQIMQNMRSGIMPTIPGIWSEDVIKVMARRMQSASNQDWLKRFIDQELKNLENPEGQSYFTLLALINHPHADHHKLLTYIRGDVPIVLDTSTMAILTALSQKAKLWNSRFLRVTHFSEGEGPYDSEERIFMPIHDQGVPHKLTMGLDLMQWAMPHSIPSVARYFNLGSTSLFDTGDWKEDTDGTAMKVFEAVSRLDPEYASIEMTGMDRKSDTPQDETQVRDSLIRISAMAPDSPVVVILPPNNLERIWRVINEVAEGRVVVMDETFAWIQKTTAHFKTMYPKNPGLKFAPDAPFKEGITLWERHQSRQPRATKDLVAYITKDRGIETITPFTLPKIKNPILLLTPYSKLNQLDGINLDRLLIIYSGSYPYSSDAASFLKANQKYLSLMPVGSTFVTQFDPRSVLSSITGINQIQYTDGPLHVSGHATRSQVVEGIQILRDGRKGREELTVIPYHVAHPEKAVRQIAAKISAGSVRFIWRKPRINLKNPLENGLDHLGFKLKLR
jgi:hypothetical protein